MQNIEQIPIELTLIENDTGPVNKRISIGADGKLVKAASADIYSARASRFRFDHWRNFGAALERMQPNMAICLGRIAPHLGIAEAGFLTTKGNTRERALLGRFTRTQQNLIYEAGLPAPVAIDFDTTGMPEAVQSRIAQLGGPIHAVASICPGLDSAAYVSRGSTSSGIALARTGEPIGGGGGHHFVVLSDGSKAQRVLDDLFDRAWIAGMGWIQIGAGGQLLRRSIIDRCVWDPSRLVFEADATLGPGLSQAPRPATIHKGGALSCPETLTVAEVMKAMDLVAYATRKAGPAGRRQRKIWGAPRIEAMVSAGTPLDVATRTIREWSKGDLYPDALINFVNPCVCVSVREILECPAKYDGWICDHPIEADYVANGKFYADTCLIFTHGHGGQTFRLHSSSEVLS